jgi:hypothetical protein
LSCIPSYGRNCSLSFHLIAMTLPFSAISQVADPTCLPPSKISFTQSAWKFFPPPCTLYLPSPYKLLFPNHPEKLFFRQPASPLPPSTPPAE